MLMRVKGWDIICINVIIVHTSSTTQIVGEE